MMVKLSKMTFLGRQYMKLFSDLSLRAFAVPEFNKMFSTRQLHQGMKVLTLNLDAFVCPRTFFCFLKLHDLEGGRSVRIYQPIQFSAMLL
jgi:hypothetical protein